MGHLSDIEWNAGTFLESLAHKSDVLIWAQMNHMEGSNI